MKRKNPTRRAEAKPHHDAFTRWWIESFGRLPSPDEVRTIKPIAERRKLLIPENRYTETVQGDLLARGDPEAGIKPFDPEAELAAAAARGVDISGDPHFLEQTRLVKIGKDRLRRKIPRPFDRKALARAKSSKREKELRRAKPKAKAAKAKTTKKVRSKVRRSSSARNEARDRKIIPEILDFLEVGVEVRLTRKRADLVPPSRKSLPTPKSTHGRSTTHDPMIWLPHWEKASLPLRAMAMGIAAGQQGAVSFTLHLGKSGMAYGQGVGEWHFARRLYRRITDALKSGCPSKGLAIPDLAFFVEQGEGERPHLHGFIHAPALKKQQRVIRNILLNAVGRDWKPRGRDRTQLEIKAMYEPIGWIEYIAKFCEVTRSKIGDNIFACSQRVTRDGRSWYKRARQSHDLLLPGGAVAVSGRISKP